ncbi:MAG: hypothetical protein ABR946_11980 [Solirubrobacteraceae bacterium]|jgi:hypothetical protein
MGSKIRTHDEAEEIWRVHRAKLPVADRVPAPVFAEASTQSDLHLRRLRRRAAGWAAENVAPRRVA